MQQPQQQMPFSRCKHCTSFSPFKAALLEKVRRLIREELRRFDADRTGIVDYALKSSERKCCGALTGECWTFCGGHGYLTIGLSQRINVSAVSYEHLPVESRRNKQIRSVPHANLSDQNFVNRRKSLFADRRLFTVDRLLRRPVQPR
ncbi:hypothetical protein niasHS_001971 [Heterodera schachtii]|uniref:SUN domain-containing protein n=1 Tax=Heterodera schachtii TaxID=97005 RepID=A0ABD2K5G1_HETSC